MASEGPEWPHLLPGDGWDRACGVPKTHLCFLMWVGAGSGHQEPRERQAAPVQWDNGGVGTEAESKTSAGSLEQGMAEVGASLGLCVLRRAR